MRRRYVLRSEATEQMDVISWCALHERQYPELKWIYHCPNGGSRTLCLYLLWLHSGGPRNTGLCMPRTESRDARPKWSCTKGG